MVYKSGFCGNGWHEGTSPKTSSGVALKVCTIDICKCECHEKFNKLFADTDTAREYFQNPQYEPPVHAFIMQDLRPQFVTVEADSNDIHDAGSNDEHEIRSGSPEEILRTAGGNKSVILASRLPGFIPGASVREFSPTETGRAARGQMEYWVKQVTDQWILDAEREILCTSSYVAEQIVQRNRVPTPPRGSIDSVFYRWRKINFCVLGEKPVRFIRYTQLGIEIGLDGCVVEYKRAKR